MKAIILAGGSGTRLWPLSRKSFPKQFLRIDGGYSLLQKTIARQLSFCSPDSIFIITNKDYYHIIIEQMHEIAEIPAANVIVEPVMRNTAPAIALATRYLVERGSCADEEPIVVVASDHHIDPEEAFSLAVVKAGTLAEQGCVVTFGIEPLSAETGYGYIKKGAPFYDGASTVEAFVEKPDTATAEKYLAEGGYLWNSGMFCFTPSTLFAELKKHSPEIYNLCQNSYDEVYRVFSEMPKISIDYAVMEKSKKVVVLPLSLTWSDIGSYDSYYELLDKDINGNVIVGNVVAIDTVGSFVIGTTKTIATIGLEDLIIIEAGDAIMVAKRGHSQKVKALVDRLKEKKFREADEHRISYMPWGTSEILDTNVGYHVERVIVNIGKGLHLKERVSLVVVKGVATVVAGDARREIAVGEHIACDHSFIENCGDEPLHIVVTTMAH